MNAVKRLFSSKYWLEILGLFIITIVFLTLKSFSFHYALSDENIYFYDAWLMSQGELPYRDFFFAHPPWHLIPGWILMVCCEGFDFYIMKGLPLLPTVVTALVIYIIVRKSSDRLSGMIAMILFLFSYDLLRASSHWTAINWAVMWMSLGYWSLLKERFSLAAVFTAMGISTGIYIVPAAAVFAVLISLKAFKKSVIFLLLLSLSLAVLNGPFIWFGGTDFFNDVIIYHLNKPASSGGGFLEQSMTLLFHNFYLLSAPLFLLLTFLVLLFIRKERVVEAVENLRSLETSSMRYVGFSVLLILLAYVVFIMTRKSLFHYYFVLLFPFAAMAGGLFFALLRSIYKSDARMARAFVSGGMLLYLAVGYFLPVLLERHLAYYTSNLGRTVVYKMPTSFLPKKLEKVFIKQLYDPERVIGKNYTGIQYYLWHESRTLDSVINIAQAIQDQKSDQGLIFGDSTSTPLVALLSGIRIADNMVDTNTMRYRANPTLIKESIETLDVLRRQRIERLEWILVNPKRGIARVKPFSSFFNQNFEHYKSFKTDNFGTYYLLHQRMIH